VPIIIISPPTKLRAREIQEISALDLDAANPAAFLSSDGQVQIRADWKPLKCRSKALSTILGVVDAWPKKDERLLLVELSECLFIPVSK
jgi:hypothetical protein